MKGSMGPPPPKNPSPPPNSDAADTAVEDAAGENEVSVDEANRLPSDTSQETENKSPKKFTPSPSPSPNASSTSSGSQQVTIPYTIPPWSEPPLHPFFLEVLKDGTIIEQLDVYEKGAYMFGRLDLCDFVLEHPTISRFHAVLQFKKDGTYLYDLGSTHGTSVNKNQVKGKVYTEIHVGDEGDLHKFRKAKKHEEMCDREASLLRAKEEASFANGISWGMADDAIEEDPENDADEITWQTYKGQFTERQEKTRSKIIKRMEKISNMKKEINAIRAKDISQGGLTQGQQMQIGRNEQRIAQIMEELDSLEETLNDSIRESEGARGGRSVGGRAKAIAEEEENTLSDEDEFYDRTKKKPSAKKSAEQQSVETADTLLDKMEVISSEIEEKRKLLAEEREKVASNEKGNNGEDELDAYISGLSSQLVIDRILQMEMNLSDLQAELNRITYLLKIADPSGEAARKRASSSNETQASKSNQYVPSISRQSQSNEKPNPILDKLKPRPSLEETHKLVPAEKPSEKDDGACENTKDKTLAYTIAKPQWLGATRNTETDDQISPANLDVSISDDFVDYNDRKKVLGTVDNESETAASGLFIRKRKSTEKAEDSVEKAPKVEVPSSSSSPKAETIAADAVALLLKHTRGIHVVDEFTDENLNLQVEGQSGKENSHARRVLGPVRPDFLDGRPDYESWVPPKETTPAICNDIILSKSTVLLMATADHWIQKDQDAWIRVVNESVKLSKIFFQVHSCFF
ncbi:hypothetical protein IEQ34_005965 [Dendrobium chrysotoxum]|uniref:FHA domain-containing protein n=1 Tax=Dendrobium chrysotoxum TaxID=161865 RepID=A0AAV7HBK3_DENCH|nr:hypothetical protein IEQ34_005965 [Dendrobium chrysotoxum]